MTLRTKHKNLIYASGYMELAERARIRAKGYMFDSNNEPSQWFQNIKNNYLLLASRYEKLSAYCEKRAMQILKQL